MGEAAAMGEDGFPTPCEWDARVVEVIGCGVEMEVVDARIG